MLQHYMPALIMLGITVAACLIFLSPAIFVKIRNDILRFYWRGFWIFPALLTACVGGQQILWLSGLEGYALLESYLAGLSAAYVTFVVFAWFRLSWVTFYGLVLRGMKTFRKKSHLLKG